MLRTAAGVRSSLFLSLFIITVSAMGFAAPSAVSVTPNQGTGLTQTFGFVFADSSGWNFLKQVNVDIDSTGANANSCLVSYMPSNNLVYLLNDAGTAYLPGMLIGSPGTLQNSQCSVNVGQSSASGSGNNLTLNVAITFNSTYSGTQSIYMDAVDNAGLNSGWQILGQWTVGTTTGGTCNAGPAPSVTICSPTNGSTVPSPVHVVAVPSSNNGVAAMAVYFDNTLVYKANVTKVDTLVNAATGSHYVVVQFWDNSGNVPAKASVNITVGNTTAPPTISLSASPTSIASGGSSTLTWSTTNATSVTIDNGIGTEPTAGSTAVFPTTTTTYTATATGPGGTATAQATVTVSSGTPPPTATFTANPSLISSGASSTLTWSTTNATSVSIDNGIGTVATSGSTAVAPTQTTTYTLTATGAGGTTTVKATVTVGTSSTCTPASPAPSVTICSPTNGSTVPSPVHVLAVPNSNTGVIAMAVYFDNTLMYKANVNKVDTLINAATGNHYVVVQFWDNSGNVPAKASVNITVGTTSPPPTTTFSASPTTISSGQSSTLNWSTTNATSVSIDNGVGTVAASGAVTVSPTTTTTYTLTATGSGGTTTAKATVTVSGSTPPPTATITASPSLISSGASSTLTWSTTNATSVSMDNGIGSVATSGSKTVTPAQTTTYTLTATGSGGTTTATATVTVGTSTTCSPASPAPSVTICSPTNGSTVSSPVHVVAVPNSNNGVVAMAVYFDNTLMYKANVNKVDTLINTTAGSHYVVVQFWDNSGNVPAKASENITVSNAPPPPPAITISPLVATIYPNATQQFTATQNGTQVGVSWYVDGVLGGNSTVGTIDVNGLYTAPATVNAHEVKAVLNSDTTQSATAVVNVVDPTQNMTTAHNDPARTGANTKEVILTPSTVTPNRFGKLGSYPVDGQVYAQPLYLSNMNIGGGTNNVVYIATEHDSVYAFDADFKKSSPYWSRSLLGVGQNPAASSDAEGISPEIGVTGTPVIDRSNNTLYVVAMVNVSGSGNQFWLHALDLTTGAEKFGGPKRINPSVNGTGYGSVNGVITIEGGCYQRVGLALANSNVYVTFGHCAHGWVAAYNETTLAQTAVFNSSPNGKGASIWMGGGAPALDSSNNLYLMTGVDADSTTNSGYSDSFIKLSPSLSLLDYFMVSNNAYLTANDADLGSGAPIVLPDNSSSYPHEVVGAGKDGRIFLVNRDNMGGFDPNANHVIQVVQSGVRQFDNFFDQPAYWNGNLYYHAEGDVIRQFKWSNGLLSSGPAYTGTVTYGVHGATASVSANGSSDGVVWELQVDGQPSGPAVLHAYDASNVSHELYNSSMNATDKAGPAVKFTVPTVVNGKVYVPAGHEVDIYGLIH